VDGREGGRGVDDEKGGGGLGEVGGKIKGFRRMALEERSSEQSPSILFSLPSEAEDRCRREIEKSGMEQGREREGDRMHPLEKRCKNNNCTIITVTVIDKHHTNHYPPTPRQAPRKEKKTPLTKKEAKNNY